MLEIIGFIALIYIVIKYLPEILSIVFNLIGVIIGLVLLFWLISWVFGWFPLYLY